jgi:uncharacterized repeat protein (TIGR02543 family)
VHADGNETGLIPSGVQTVNGVASLFAETSGGDYTITYTVVHPGTDISDAAPLPVSITLKDVAGNIGAEIASILAADAPGIDANAPAAPVIDTPASPTNNNTPTITGTGEPGATVVLTSSIDGANAVTDVVAGGGTWSITAAALSDNTHSLTAVQTDPAGNPSVPSGVKTLVIDTHAPTVSAGGNDGDEGVQFTQIGHATDTVSGVASYHWVKKSGPYAVTFGTDTASSTTVSAAGAGYYILELGATDGAGNTASDTASFTWGSINVPILSYNPASGATNVPIDDGVATVTFGGSSSSTLLSDAKVTLVNNATGDSVATGTIEISGGNGASHILNIPYTGLVNNTVYRINVLASAIRDDSYHVNSDGVSYFTTVAAASDTTPPVVTAFTADSVSTSTATLSVTTDENATCAYATTTKSYASSTAMAVTGGVMSHSQDLTGLSPGTGYVYYVRCQDSHGNTMSSSDSVTFTTTGADTTGPTFVEQAPAGGNTNVSISPGDLYVRFNEALNPTTIGSNSVKLCRVSDGTCTSPVNIGSPMLTENGTMIRIGGPGVTLSYDTAYWIEVTADVTDLAGNHLVAPYGSTTTSEFTTIVEGDGSLVVTSITPSSTYATIGGGWAGGWSWVFNITVPASEASTSMRFADWVSGSSFIPVFANATSNIRIYSAQSSNATSPASAIYMTAAGVYSSPMMINGDRDSSALGRQIQVIVEARVPALSAGGSYTTSYGVQSSAPVVTYTVTYNKNGGDVDANPTSTAGIAYDTATTLPTPPTKTGYTFAGWNTQSGGGGTAFTGATLVTADVTVYAQWTANTGETVTYNGNGNDGGDVPIDSSSPYTTGNTVTVLGNVSSTPLAKTGYTFDHWNTAAGGSGTSYAPAATFSITGNIILYAQWTAAATYTVIFDKNGGNVDANPTSTAGIALNATTTLPTPPGRTGYTFAGWFTAPTGGTAFTDATPVTADVTVYAQWTANTGETVTYDGNGNDGGTVPTDGGSGSYTTGDTVTVLGNPGSLTLSGSTFGGWSLTVGGSATSSFSITGNTILYAVWAPPV